MMAFARATYLKEDSMARTEKEHRETATKLPNLRKKMQTVKNQTRQARRSEMER